MRSSPGRVALGLVAAAVAATVLVPVGYLVMRASELGLDGARTVLLRPRTAELAGNTVRLAAVVTVAAAALGVGLARLVTSAVSRGRSVLIGLLAAPLAIPSYVAGFVWTRLFPGFEGFWAAALILVLACYPLVLLPAAAAFTGMGRGQEDAARTLGLGPVAVFARVTLPRVWPACAGGSLLVALYAISDFGGPAVVRYEPFTVGIYNAYNGAYDRSTPAIYGCVLAVVAIALAAAERGMRRDAPSAATAERPTARSGAVGAWVVSAVVLLAGIAVPVAGLLREITESTRLGFTTVGGALAWAWPDLRATLMLSVTAAAVIALAALPVAVYTARPPGPGAGPIEAVSYLGYALPGVTVALATVFVGIRLLPDWYLTTPLLIACYAVLFLPVCLGPARQALDAIPPRVPDAARTLGASDAATFARVRLPLAAPGIAAGAALACLSVAKELPATLMLAPVGTSTLATHMWSLNNDVAYGRAAVLGLLLVLVASVPTVALSMLLTREGQR